MGSRWKSPVDPAGRTRNAGGVLRFTGLMLVVLGLAAPPAGAAITYSADGYHVHPGDNIQDALQQAATNSTHKVVHVHAGEYRPNSKRQALIWFNKRHEGIRLLAVGAVTLNAANPALATPQEPGYPAVVNHVVYFGDGISSNTVLQGFRITGANGFITKQLTRQLEPDITLPKNLFFFSDGGAIKIFGRSYPTLRDLEIADNYTSPCGAGISVQHEGYNQLPVLIENCRFLRNRTRVTGAAIDLLAGSQAHILNCLFVGNASNLGEDPVAQSSGEPPFQNNGVLTIFRRSRALVRDCTFTGNRNAVDDMGGESTYTRCLFIDNNLEMGLKGFPRYGLAAAAGVKVTGCLFNETLHDLGRAVSPAENVLRAPPPQFDARFVPAAPEYKGAGYRPSPVASGP